MEVYTEQEEEIMKIRKIREKIRKSVFLETVKVLWKNKKLTLLMILFDLLFLIVMYEFGILTGLIKTPSVPVLATINMLLYFLIFASIYSFITYVVMYYVKSLTKKSDFSFDRFGRFLLMNVIIIGGLMILLTVFQIFSVFVLNLTARPIFATIITLLVFFFGYPYINLSHSFFTHGLSWKKSLAKSLNVVFKRIKKYISVYAISILIILFFVIIFYLIGIILKSAITNYALFVIVLGAMGKIYTVIITIVYYLLLLVNRAYFYMIAEKLK